jgi:uncharacterized protein with HEPN domain
MNPDDAIRIRHMLDAAEDIRKFVEGRRLEHLNSDRMLAFAIVRAIEIFGEAAARLSPGARADADAVPWSAIVAMRNRLIHAYSNIDLEIVWKAATEEIPALVPALASMLPERS